MPTCRIAHGGHLHRISLHLLGIAVLLLKVMHRLLPLARPLLQYRLWLVPWQQLLDVLPGLREVLVRLVEHPLQDLLLLTELA